MDPAIEALGMTEIPLYDARGNVYARALMHEVTMFQLTQTYQALRRKRNPSDRALVAKLLQWADHLNAEEKRGREDHASRWRDRLKNVVYSRDSFAITVNDINDATFVVLWCDGKRVGEISTRPHSIDGVKYVGIGRAEIEPGCRGRGFGLEMYRALLKHTATAGIASYLPDRKNKKAIPAIYRRLGGSSQGDYAIIPKR